MSEQNEQYWLITYSQEQVPYGSPFLASDGTSQPMTFNAIIEGTPVDWLIEEIAAAVKVRDVRHRRFPDCPVPPPRRPPVLLASWPLTKEQFLKLRPIMWGGAYLP